MDKDWLFRGDGYLCDLRAVGVLVQGGKILVQRERGGCEYALPGGHVKIGETTVDALCREFAEETGLCIHCERLLWTEECFWEWNGANAHSIAFYYLVSVTDGLVAPTEGNFIPHRDNNAVEIGWMPIAELDNFTIYPTFLKTAIHEPDAPIKHFISK